MHVSLDKLSLATDETAKFLFHLNDASSVESVLVPFASRDAVCLSSQVGCAMGCTFCFTSLMGLKRHLSSEEMIAQYEFVKSWVIEKNQGRLPPNIVFMGQGEPLHNFEELKKAILWFTHPKLGKLGPRQITVSTSGFVPGLERFDELGGVNLALSLHSPFNDQRSELIPLNRRWPIQEVFKTIDKINLRSRQFINLEYLMISNFNMSKEHARALSELAFGRKVIINLIPFNPYPGTSWKRPSMDEIETFKKFLVAQKLRVFLRTTKGDEIMAACGQLNTLKELQ